MPAFVTVYSYRIKTLDQTLNYIVLLEHSLSIREVQTTASDPEVWFQSSRALVPLIVMISNI